MMVYNKNMENNIIKLTYKDKKITLIPTAHVSKESAELTRQVIDEIKPDSICIELDKDRYESMKNPDKFKNTDIIKVIKEKRTTLMLVNLILANYQKKIATKLDSQSGNEMLIGIEKANELNANLVLADRNVQTTFKRVWANLNLKDKYKLIEAIIDAMFSNEEVSEEELANLQQSDALNAALNELSISFPHIAEVLVDERDKYLAHKIKNAPGENIVAILGAAHTINVPKYIEQDYSIEQYDVIPPKKLSSKLAGWIIPVAILILILFSFKIDANVGFNQIKAWILINGSLAAIGTAIGGGHILSILTAFIAAPITSLNPLLAAGWFAGLTQAYVTKPTVADFETLSKDCESVKGFWKNKVSRILIIVLLGSLGSSIGTFVSGISIIKSIFGLL